MTEQREGVEGWVFAFGSGAGKVFECGVGNLFVPGKNSALEVGAMELEDREKIERAEVGVESVIVREVEWCLLSLSGHLERWCFAQGRDLKLHPLDMTGAAGCWTEGSPLET